MALRTGEHVDSTKPKEYNCEDTNLLSGDLIVWKCLETGKNIVIKVVSGIRFVVSQVYSPEEQ